ncbi:MAG: alanine--tRNA ligase [Phycisphaerae bacterium]
MKTSKEIRSEFLEFFQQHGHTFVPSSSLLPAEDPTLLFANAGMNQFKDIFLGREKRDYTRAVNSQKCIRAGGKHNDLEDVGHDTYHHTFFEMLGNWSFGDYFKAEAIRWAWELLTKVWKLPPDRLYATVFEGCSEDGLDADTEAEDLWKSETDIDPSHIFRGPKADNFWEMGETGPCGPCSEVHIDLTADGSGAKLVNAGDPRVIEIWNLVFMQYNRAADGSLSPLPATHVDTGMGFERICAVMQGKHSNYASDLFRPLIEAVEARTGHRYGSSAEHLEDRFDVMGEDDIRDVACRVIADHARALTFAIADGITPSNEGRGYVLRRICRRAARYARQYLEISEPFLADMVGVIHEQMADHFPEIRHRYKVIEQTIRDEEESFARTIRRGLSVFWGEVTLILSMLRDQYCPDVPIWQDKQDGSLVIEVPNKGNLKVRTNADVRRALEELDIPERPEITGQTAFDLYATDGFPVDLTQVMARECGLSVDMDGFRAEMDKHRAVSAAGGDAFKVDAITDLPGTDDSPKYGRRPIEAKVLGWVIDGKYTDSGELPEGAEAGVVLDRTNLYAEQGGQVGDTGRLVFDGGEFHVTDTRPAGQCVLHVGAVESGRLKAGTTVRCEVDPSRLDTMRNHTATHLLNWALREVLGEDVNQAGSMVDPHRLRFDFSYNQALTREQLAEVERLVNERILADEPVHVEVRPLAEARKIPGVRAVFGEKYPDPVRVVLIGGGGNPEAGEHTSAEFCGGTHLPRTSVAGMLKITDEESVAKGVRRITAVTGHGAYEWVRSADETLHEITTTLKAPAEEAPKRLAAMQKEIKELKKARRSGSGDEFQADHTLETSAGTVLVGHVDHNDSDAMRNLCDRHRQKGAAALLVGGSDGEKVTLVAMVSEQVAGDGKLKAGDWVKTTAKVLGGAGGGKPTMAQAGGKDPAKLPDALAEAARYAGDALK